MSSASALPDNDAESIRNGPAPRVLHLDDGRLWRGGQHQVWLLMRELAGRGIAQRLLARGDAPLAARARELGIDVEPFRFLGEWDWFNAGRIVRLACAFDANILHAHTAHAHAVGLWAARRLGESVKLVTTRRVDFPMKRGPLSRLFFSGRKYQYPRQHFIAISNGVRRVLIDGGVAPERIDVVFSGVPPIPADKAKSREEVRRELAIADDEIAILNAGALTDHKGQRWLIEAAPRVTEACPRARFHILGEGELHGALQSQIQNLGLADRVRLHGFVDDARLKLAGFDLYVSSSHLEGLGTAILDAMLAGLPVVAAATGGVPDAVIGGETGRLAPPRDPRTLADAIVEALNKTEDSRRMIANARRRVTEHFSARAMAEGTLAVYRKLLA